jgi:hypothetical protein
MNMKLLINNQNLLKLIGFRHPKLARTEINEKQLKVPSNP